MPKRNYRSKREWRRLIEKQAGSGLSALAFCQQQGLSTKTFYRQRKLLHQQNLIPVSRPFVQIQPKPMMPESSHAGILFQHRESRLSVSADTDPSWLAQLMKAL